MSNSSTEQRDFQEAVRSITAAVAHLEAALISMRRQSPAAPIMQPYRDLEKVKGKLLELGGQLVQVKL